MSFEVDVYRNLNNGLLSIKLVHWVIGYADQVVMINVQFVVSQAGRERALREGRKNVHAVARGRLITAVGFTGRKMPALPASVTTPSEPLKKIPSSMREVTYNPYKFSSFVDLKTHQPVYKANLVLINKDGYIVASKP